MQEKCVCWTDFVDLYALLKKKNNSHLLKNTSCRFVDK